MGKLLGIAAAFTVGLFLGSDIQCHLDKKEMSKNKKRVPTTKSGYQEYYCIAQDISKENSGAYTFRWL